MTDERDLLERLAGRGEIRGADDVLSSARLEARDHRRPTAPRVMLAAAALVLIVGGAMLLSGRDDPARVDATDDAPGPVDRPTTPTTTASTTPGASGTDAPTTSLFAFDVERGVVRIADGSEPEALGGRRGEEGETNLAVSADGLAVFHDIVATGCLQQIVRTGLDGSSDIEVESGIHPAPDPSGRYLAYARGTTCTSDADVLLVRDLTTATEREFRYEGDGLETRIEDIEWVGGQIVVLARQYDGDAPASAFLDVYDVTPSGAPEFDRGVVGPAATISRATPFDQVTGIEPVPGTPSTLVGTIGSPDRTGPTTFVTIDVESGAMAEQFLVDTAVTSFAPRATDDVYYVGIEPKVDGVSAQVDLLMHRTGGRDELVGKGLNSVAV